jgi:hypothetical protein
MEVYPYPQGQVTFTLTILSRLAYFDTLTVFDFWHFGQINVAICLLVM